MYDRHHGTQSTLSGITAAYHYSGTGLRCLPGCHCRCHDSSFSSIIPAWIAWAVGKIFISKRLLYPPWSSWSRCNFQTCRGDFLRTVAILWLLPRVPFLGYFRFSTYFKFPLTVCVGAVRTIPWDSPLLLLAKTGDVQGIRELFTRGQASIWDTTVNGHSLFYVHLQLFRCL